MNLDSIKKNTVLPNAQTVAFAANPRLASLREERKAQRAQIPVDFLDGRGASRRASGSAALRTSQPAADHASQRSEQEAYFTALSSLHGGDEESVRVSITLMESIRAEPDPVKQKALLVEALRDIGQVVVAQIMAAALCYYGFPKLAMEAQKYAAKGFAKLIARGFRWAFGIQN